MTNELRRIREEEKEKLATEELNFLQNQMGDEDRRREVIEGKTGQLLGQVSIVVSIIALFIPLISDQINSLSTLEKIISIVLFFAVVITFIASIWVASASWIIHKYGYDRPDLNDLSKPGKPESRLVFMQRYKDILSATLVQHVKINNEKGTKLIRAAAAFRIGILLLGVFVISLSIALGLEKREPKKMEISGPVKIEFHDSIKSKK